MCLPNWTCLVIRQMIRVRGYDVVTVCIDIYLERQVICAQQKLNSENHFRESDSVSTAVLLIPHRCFHSVNGMTRCLKRKKKLTMYNRINSLPK